MSQVQYATVKLQKARPNTYKCGYKLDKFISFPASLGLLVCKSLPRTAVCQLLLCESKGECNILWSSNLEICELCSKLFLTNS